MTAHEKGRDLIERYLYQVGEELPRKQRDDVKAELRSLLEDAIEERASAGRPFDEDLAVGVLREFGEPGQVAQRYRPAGQYLIGPRLFPTYVTVARIVLIVLACVYAVFAGLSMVAAPTRLPEMFRPGSLWGFASSLATMAFFNLAILTAVFALIERFGGIHTFAEWGAVKAGFILAARAKPEEPAEWDPRKLPAIPTDADPERISVGDRVFKIYATVALLVWVNFFPETVGIWFFTGDHSSVLRFSEMGFYLPVLLLNIFWVMALGLNTWLLKLGRWTRETRWAELGLGLYGAAVLYMVLVSSAFAGENSAALAGTGLQSPLALLEAARADLPRWGRYLHILLTWILLFTLFEALLRLYRILRRYPVW